MTFLAQGFAPGDCLLTGLCGIKPVIAAIPSGLGFLALALVLYGALGLRRKRTQTPPDPPSG